MFPKELIGKKAIRTAPTCKGDHSYMNEPLFIAKATESHVVYTHPKENSFSRIISSSTPYILDSTWVDDNWTDYEVLMSDIVVDPEMPVNMGVGIAEENGEGIGGTTND